MSKYEESTTPDYRGINMHAREFGISIGLLDSVFRYMLIINK